MANVFKVIGILTVIFVIGTCGLIMVGVGTVANDPDFQDAVEEMQESSGGLTGPRGNAVRSAKQYLKMSGFSRSGLIKQLSYGVGEGYNVADATAAVDSLGVDWNEQAARSAKQYLSISGFSCKGLVDQLSSESLEGNRAYYSGDGYTKSQATYGARQAGAC